MRAHRPRLLVVPALALAAGGGLAACGPPPLVMPQPPQDLTALAQSYASPTGTVDTAHLQQTVQDVEAELATRNLSWLPVLIADQLVLVEHRFDDSGFPINPATVRKKNRPALEAVVVVNHICEGWTQPPGPPNGAENGTIDLTATIDDGELQRAVWGTATSCEEQVLSNTRVPVNGFLSGALAITLQGPLPANDQQAEALVLISGQVGTQNNVISGSFDFAIVDKQVQFRHQVADGDIIVSVGPTSVGLRGQNGTFTCDATTLACTQS